MTSIIFQNPGLLDLRAVTTMGISAKPDSRNPIGQFGTGLKYAIAVTLRTGGSFDIYLGQEHIHFFLREEEFRGKLFNIIHYINHTKGLPPVSLGVTTELGKNWEPWMAVRELESNVRDENGKSWIETKFEILSLEEDSTTIIVQGGAMVDAYSKIGEVFLTSVVKEHSASMTVHEPRGSHSSAVYYRGIKTGQLESPGLYDYNIIETQTLTEDRTLKFPWLVVSAIREFFMTDCQNHTMLVRVLTASEGTLEQKIDWGVSVTMSQFFIDTVKDLGARCSISAYRKVREHLGLVDFDEVEPDEYQQAMLAKAILFLTKGGHDVTPYPIKVVKDLGAGCLGRATKRTIYLSVRVFEMGQKQLTSCLLEEFIHLDRGLADNCYEMQSFLFDHIIALMAKLQKEVL
jgi:hypothetical protein